MKLKIHMVLFILISMGYIQLYSTDFVDIANSINHLDFTYEKEVFKADIIIEIFDNTTKFKKMIGKINVGDKVEIIGSTHDINKIAINELLQKDDVYLLVKKDDTSELFSGWIRAKDGFKYLKQKVNLIKYGLFEISPDLNYVAFDYYGNSENEIDIYSRMGEIKNRYNLSAIKKQYSIIGSYNSYSPVTWLMNSCACWYVVCMDEWTICFIKININDEEVQIVDFKGEFEYDINPWNSKIVYSDFPFQFDTDTAEETKNSRKLFSLKIEDPKNERSEIIATNYGIGFDPKWKDKQTIVYIDSDGNSIERIIP